MATSEIRLLGASVFQGSPASQQDVDFVVVVVFSV